MAGSPRQGARVVAIVQARMSSSRLAGKVLADVGGEPAIHLLLRRLRSAHELGDVVVATSVGPDDDELADAVAQVGVRIVRGPLEDVLGRFLLAGEEAACDAVVRLTGDCPLIDPAVVDLAVRRWREGGEDYVANVLPPRTYPSGLDVEVVSWPALVAAGNEATAPEEREHVTPFLRERPERFRQARLDLDPPAADLHLSIDTLEDLERVRAVVAAVGVDAAVAEIIAVARQLGR
jgi:spore coat polysaccharide biosynthesis protein SpsF (cytidylyltransferase family)